MTKSMPGGRSLRLWKQVLRTGICTEMTLKKVPPAILYCPYLIRHEENEVRRSALKGLNLKCNVVPLNEKLYVYYTERIGGGME